jgi:hypothetical protein
MALKRIKVDKSLDGLLPRRMEPVKIIALVFHQHDCKINVSEKEFKYRDGYRIYEQPYYIGTAIKDIGKAHTAGTVMDSVNENFLENHVVYCYPDRIKQGIELLKNSLGVKMKKMDAVKAKIRKSLRDLERERI